MSARIWLGESWSEVLVVGGNKLQVAYMVGCSLTYTQSHSRISVYVIFSLARITPRFPELQLGLQRWRREKWPTRRSIMFIPKVFGRNFVSFFLFDIFEHSERVSPGDAVVVNPEISSGIPLAGVNRWPQPGSRPEKYSSPATKGRA